jgi:predicted transcriptional regulator of viral defense system
MKKGLGEAERLLFAYVQMRGQPTVRSGELLKPLGLTPAGERNLLSRLSKAGWIARVRRGLYLIPPRLPLGGKWSPDEVLALNTVISDAGGRYQICGPNAFNRYGFDEQIPTRLYAYNDRISGALPSAESTCHYQSRERPVRRYRGDPRCQGLTAVLSRVRTLVDAVYDWSRFNSLQRLRLDTP